MLKNEYPSSYNAHDVDNMSVQELDDLLDYLDSMQNKANGGMMLDNTKTYHQANDYTAPPDLEVMIGYANGGGVGSMMQPKKKKFEMQGGKKPARNYLGKQKTVSGVPLKWQSGPDTPPTELAYITQKEKDLILKKNLHGSLKNGPNTGPDGIMSLDSQGDYTRDRSPGAYSSGPAGSGTGNTQQDLRNRAMNERHMKELLTGQKNIGQTVQTGPRTRQYSDLPEWVQVLQPDGTYKNKHVASAYKSYGQPSFWGNLFSRGARGYRGIKGVGAFGKNPLKNIGLRDGPQGPEYFSDYEDFGETRGAMPFGIMGIIANALNSFKKPKDFSSDNRLGLYEDRFKEDFEIDPTVDRRRAPNAWSDGTFTWGGNKKNIVQPKSWTIEDEMEEVSNYRAPPTGIMMAGGYPGNWGTTPFDPAMGNPVPEGIAFNNPVGGVDQFYQELVDLEKSAYPIGGTNYRIDELGGTLEDYYRNKAPRPDNKWVDKGYAPYKEVNISQPAPDLTSSEIEDYEDYYA